MARNDRDYWGQERGPEDPAELPSTPAPAVLAPSVPPARRRLTAREEARLYDVALKTGRTLEEVATDERAAGRLT